MIEVLRQQQVLYVPTEVFVGAKLLALDCLPRNSSMAILDEFYPSMSEASLHFMEDSLSSSDF